MGNGNVAAIVRICCNMDCASLFLVHDEKTVLPKISAILRQSAQGCAFWKEGRGRFVKYEELADLLPANRVTFGVDTLPAAVDVFEADMCQSEPACKPCFLFGSASEGISQPLSPPLLNLCDNLLSVQLLGPMKSLVGSHTMAIVLFQWLRQQSQAES